MKCATQVAYNILCCTKSTWQHGQICQSSLQIASGFMHNDIAGCDHLAHIYCCCVVFCNIGHWLPDTSLVKRHHHHLAAVLVLGMMFGTMQGSIGHTTCDYQRLIDQAPDTIIPARPFTVYDRVHDAGDPLGGNICPFNSSTPLQPCKKV